jgi:hypothetical protein
MVDGPLPARAVARVHPGAARPLRAPLVSAAVTLAATALVAVHSPYQAGSYGYCPLHALTGLWCPMCGGLRATHDLAHGDLAAAWGMNPLWVTLVPLVVGGWVLWLVRSAQGRPMPRVSPAARWAAIAVVVAFGVLRNVPALAPWLAP